MSFAARSGPAGPQRAWSFAFAFAAAFIVALVGAGANAQPVAQAEASSVTTGASAAGILQACARLASSAVPAQAVERRALLQRMEAARPQCIGHPPFLALLGALWLEEGEADQALIWLERSLLLDPGNLGAQADHALALAQLGQPAAREALVGAWWSRSDIPPALRQRLALARLANVDDPPPKVRFGGPDNGRWASFREASVVLGYESNLDHSPKLAEITLTPPGGPIDLPLLNPLKPRRGAAIASDLAWQMANSPEPGRIWRAGISLGGRHSPSEPASDWHHIQLAASASQQWAPWRGLLEVQASWLGGPLNEPYRVLRGSAAVERNALGCSLRMALEGEARTQAETRSADGRTVGLLWRSQCPLGASRTWSWGAALRAAVDRPVDPLRAGGEQRLWSAGSRLLGHLGADTRVDASLRITTARDQEGYSPLLEDNARRQNRQIQLSVELTRPVTLPGGWRAEALAQLQLVRQTSNITLFEYDAASAYVGLRWSW